MNNDDATVPAPAQNEPTPFDDGELYDLVCENLDYGLDFYLGLAKSAIGPVLEVACGTGRVLLRCLRAGTDIDGLDLSSAMLDRLRHKAAAEGLRPRVYEASMSSFQLDRRYALIMITFNAFVHNLTTEDQIATLTRCRDHLLPGGLLAFDGFFPGAALITLPDNSRVLEGELTHPETGLPVRFWDTRTFNRVDQIQYSLNEVEFLDAAGNVTETRRSRSSMRWIYKGEMELLLRVAGFARWRIDGDFDGRPLVNETDAMIVQAWTSTGP